MTVSSKIRIYDLAKELKLDTKRLIEEVRREGVDVSVPSNSVSKELAEKIRNKYFPKKETAVKRGVRVVKRAERAGRPSFHLYVISEDGQGLERLTFDGQFNSFPMFSPDGKSLVWVSDRQAKVPGEFNVFLADWVP